LKRATVANLFGKGDGLPVYAVSLVADPMRGFDINYTTLLYSSVVSDVLPDSRMAADVRHFVPMIANALVTACVIADTKQRFVKLARRHDLTESALLKRLVDAALAAESGLVMAGIDPVAPVGRDPRVYVRLRPEDLLLLRERATARSMPAATYVSTLVRSHLHSLTPLPAAELAILRQSVMEIAAIGRNLNQIARAANRGETPTGPNRAELQALLRALTGLRDHFKAFIASNLASWSAGYEKTPY
jgi:hypothetical protein